MSAAAAVSHPAVIMIIKIVIVLVIIIAIVALIGGFRFCDFLGPLSGMCEAGLTAIGISSDLAKGAADLGRAAADGTGFQELGKGIFASEDADFQERRAKCHDETMRILTRRQIARAQLQAMKAFRETPGIMGTTIREYHQPMEALGKKGRTAWQKYQDAMKEKLVVYACENRLLDKVMMLGESTEKKHYREGYEEGGIKNGKQTEMNAITRVAAGLPLGMIFKSMTSRGEPLDRPGESFVIEEGFWTRTANDDDGADDLETAGQHPTLKGSKLKSDELSYMCVPPGVCVLATDWEAFKFRPYDPKTYWACVGPYDGNITGIDGKVTSVAVWELRPEMVEFIAQRGGKLTPDHIIKEFDYAFQVWKWNKWRPILEAKCGTSNDAVMFREDRTKKGGDWWCVHGGSYARDARTGDKENHKDTIPISMVEELDWLKDVKTPQRSPLHQVNNTLGISHFYAASKCNKGTGYEKCQVPGDEVAFMVVPPRWAVMVQGENKHIDRYEGMHEVTGPFVGTVQNVGLVGETKSKWNSGTRTMKAYFDRENPRSSDALRGMSEKRGKVSGARIRRVGETPCTGCGCFIRRKKDLWKYQNDSRQFTRYKHPNQGWKNASLAHIGVGAGPEFRTEADHKCPGGWAKDNLEHWKIYSEEQIAKGGAASRNNAEGRIHTKATCLARNKNAALGEYEFMWRDCSNDTILPAPSKEQLLKPDQSNEPGVVVSRFLRGSDTQATVKSAQK